MYPRIIPFLGDRTSLIRDKGRPAAFPKAAFALFFLQDLPLLNIVITIAQLVDVPQSSIPTRLFNLTGFVDGRYSVPDPLLVLGVTRDSPQIKEPLEDLWPKNVSMISASKRKSLVTKLKVPSLELQGFALLRNSFIIIGEIEHFGPDFCLRPYIRLVTGITQVLGQLHDLRLPVFILLIVRFQGKHPRDETSQMPHFVFRRTASKLSDVAKAPFGCKYHPKNEHEIGTIFGGTQPNF